MQHAAATFLYTPSQDAVGMPGFDYDGIKAQILKHLKDANIDPKVWEWHNTAITQAFLHGRISEGQKKELLALIGKRMNRRDFLRIFGAAAATVAVAYASSGPILRFIRDRLTGVVAPEGYSVKAESNTAANVILLGFPPALTGAKRIDKYLTPGARYLLVHIRQMHFNPNATKTKEDVDKIWHVQNSIYQIISDLISRSQFLSVNNLTVPLEVFSEGHTVETKGLSDADILYKQMDDDRLVHMEMELDFLQKEVEAIDCAAQSHSVWIGALAEHGNNSQKASEYTRKKREEDLSAIGGLKSRLAEARQNRQHREYVRMAAGAAEKMAVERKIRLLPAEGFAENKTAGLVAGDSQRVTKEMMPAVLETREDKLLHIISARGKPLAIVVYGAGHAWGGAKSFGNAYDFQGRPESEDNIAKWNEKNPDKKLSLIEITPEGV